MQQYKHGPEALSTSDTLQRAVSAELDKFVLGYSIVVSDGR